ncbi:helix-turn-helix DNA-binding domain protein [Streptomyces phage Eklok]|uniref:Helix-turn-helix DNA binding domain protein n=1 Tax=Streptomyces phage Eklok TaxID=2743999 RepID=A0A7D5FQQ6_9CAUD|nr:helix-turn-helix DNA-binding domain protein [Streptomyces phage Eklok]QLF83225.1 helix-turn-helix DNA-binding domain protein [Streptomyces phage Eklok]
MTLDAQDWVWTRSRTRGNARLVMLAIADAITGPEATAKMGTAEVMQRLNTAAKSTARDAIAAALASGELTIDQPAAGSRAARYCIPGAVNYVRESRTQPDPGQRSGIPDTTNQRSGIPDTTGPATGRESRTQPTEPENGLWSGIPDACGRESGTHHPPIEGMNEGVMEDGPPSSIAPDFARPLVDKITAAKVYPAWDLTPGEWLRINALIKRSGIDMLATVAVQIAAKKRIAHARYFLRAWQSLPAAPTPGTAAPEPGPGADVIPLRPTGPGRVAQAADWYANLI